MPTSVQLVARQPRNGAPIDITEYFRDVVQETYTAWVTGGIGSKAGATAPANTSELAGILAGGDTPHIRQYDEDYRLRFAADVQVGLLYFLRIARTVPLDSNYAAGRYVFAYVAGGDGAILAHSAGYHIH